MSWYSAPRRRNKTRPTLAALASYTALAVFLSVFLILGLFNRVELPYKKKRPQYNFPDFDRINTLTRVLTRDHVDLRDLHGRIIFIGDVHGMNDSLHRLLKQLDYDPSHDTIFFAGDLLAKSSHSSSLSVLSFLTEHHMRNGVERMFPVRGNHDQMIVQWRAWRAWFEGLTLDPHAASQTPRFLPSTRLIAFDCHLSSFLKQFFTQSAADASDSVPPVSTGREFLQLLEAEWAIARAEDGADPEEYTDVARKRAQGTWRAEWWKRIPLPGKGREKQQWRMFGDHYWLARDMTQEQADYLMSLPLVLHVPHIHFFVVHAGLLPSDPRLPPTDRNQPLAHAPAFTRRVFGGADEGDTVLLSRLQAHLLPQESAKNSFAAFKPSRDSDTSAIEDLRRLQEAAILSDIPQNRDPWVVLNMRSVTKKKHKVTREGDKGTPWSKLWNEEMNACKGYDVEAATRSEPRGYELPCHPATVVYGHAATRGLDIKRWSMGLDTGCLYGRKLTALVLNNSTDSGVDDVWDNEDDWDEDEDEDDDEEDDDDEEAIPRPRRKRLQFGDPGSRVNAKIVSVKCPNIDDDDD
ncbi:uncharacterized protein PHACADRAFT_140136 [Phanerochaete carnosa HHB-10118-sp]|uniref:Calcineurin-like phosphoesterase domain-containing protein n=1 Tax=Phanerochaete carnosa (strain HHB-10118-sp) TaxID=650164 RepID=K5WGW8_PHACS|nr:uncharacterized protein PHACADRAFT_140136 [Phanerochaete carnosa HHB-10118-sp]EKM58314.1 hypothetical protein PHACADRAFT_140136 [Phanerochaete carnosa HHB-10118-sp]